jgi:lysophospholipase L1-like esterase
MRFLSALLTSTTLIFTSLHAAAAPLVKTGESIAFLGDSITNQGAATPGGYVRLVESGFAAHGIQPTILPAGVGGNKSNQMLERLDKDVLSKNPTWMTLSCGVNDVWQGNSGVPLEDYKKNITQILDRCQQAGVKVMLFTATQIYLPLTNGGNTKLGGYNDFLRETAKARNLPLADVSAAMAAEQANLEAAGIKRVLTVDGVHMNIYGNVMMAKTVLAAFGLDEGQIAAAEAKWQDIPETCITTPKAAISLAELKALEAYAKSQNKSVETVLDETWASAIRTVVQGAPAK